ncbi:MAG: prephenate dehydrogenase [Lachnospiraceae bacterium]|nr:prephenate dehydrogenase [Lachnospiraceae bacterium]
MFKIGFIGLGLIGGSLAKSIRRHYPETIINAFDINSATLMEAHAEGVVNTMLHTVADFEQQFQNCDYIFLCTPVESFPKFLPALKKVLTDHTILSDVGSVKSCVHKEMERYGLNKYFIGGHPMAGSEKSGYQSSTDILLENAFFILTPTPETSSEQLTAYSDFVQSIGAIPLQLVPAEHDRVVAAVSHLPHIIASSLVNLVSQEDTDEYMRKVAAGGFKDITRIASSNSQMWQNICMANQYALLEMLDLFIEGLQKTRTKLADGNGDALFSFFATAKEYRDSIPNTSKGIIHKSFLLHCELPDEAGGIAVVATILASKAINIKNIGILNNRETESGALQIEFYDEDSLMEAHKLLTKHHYIVECS